MISQTLLRRFSLPPCSMVMMVMAFSLSDIHAAEATPEELLRQGLFEEEANRNFDKAAEHYRALVAAHDRQRALAATATFRLGEIARKKNDKNAASSAFRMVAERFPEQADLARMSRENLTALGVALPDIQPVAAVASPNDAEDLEIEKLRHLLRNSPDLIDGAAENGWRPLHLAAAAGRTKVAAYLIGRKVDVDSRTTGEKLTPLHLAAINGRLGVVNALLEAKAKVDGTVEFRPDVYKQLPPRDEGVGKLFGEWTALDLAILYDRREVARALIKAGADVTRTGPMLEPINGQPLNALRLCVYLQRNTIARDIMDVLPPYADPADGQFAGDLTFAVRYNMAMVEPIMGLGRKFGYPDLTGGSEVLGAAVSEGGMPVVKLLLESGADVKAVDDNKRTVLFRARTPEMVEYLLAAGVDLNAKDKDGRTAIDLVISESIVSGDKNPAILDTLLKHGAVMEEPEAMLSRASEGMLKTVLRKIVYPKAWRADKIFLMLGSPSSSTVRRDGLIELSYHRQFRVLESKSGGVGVPKPLMSHALTDEIKEMMRGNSFVLRIIRRDEQGGFKEIEIGKWHPDSKEWGNLTQEFKPDLLKWGDIIEIRQRMF